MRSPTEDTQRAAAEGEAAAWIARLDRGLERKEQRQLEHWLTDATNRRALDELNALWHGLDAISSLADSPVAGASGPVGNRARRPARLPLATAAGLAVAALTWLLLPGPEHVPRVASLPRPSIFETPIGGTRTIELDDGSSLVLNTATRARVEYSAGLRSVALLRGEAYFDVAHDPGRPFRVHAGPRTFEALGTAFGVQRMSDAVELIVTEGRVRVAAPSATQRREAPGTLPAESSAVVVAGQRGLFGPDGSDVHAFAPAASDAALAWQRGMLVFDDTPLRDVLAEANRYTATRLALDDPSLGSLRVVGSFRAGDLEGLLAALQRNFEIDSRPRGGEIVLTHR